jgi:hypothetical protein
VNRILPIVEGAGDLLAVPELVRRIAANLDRFDVEVLRPQIRGDLPKVRARFNTFLEVALLENASILWVVDYDCEDCKNVELDLVQLNAMANAAARGRRVRFALMVQEFETLFLSDHETTKRVFPDIAADMQFPVDPEGIRDAKGWISKARPKGLAYKPTQHQQRLAAQVDLGRLRTRSPSFVRFESAIEDLLLEKN